MDREDLEHTARFKSAKNRSKDIDRCVRALAQGRHIAMAITSATPIPRGPRKNASSVELFRVADRCSQGGLRTAD